MARRRSEAGFTMMEVVVALFVLSIVLIGMLALFDASNRVARTQVHIADMQQSLRIGHDEMVRMTRSAARGWTINGTTWKPGDQVKVVVDNAGGAVSIDNGTVTDCKCKVRPGTDVLRIRGVVAGSMFDVDNGNEISTDLRLKAVSPAGLKQDLDQIKRAKEAGNDFNLLVVSRQGEVGTVDATVTKLSPTTGTATEATITMDTSTAVGDWMKLLAAHPLTLMGIVEEYAFYIRDEDGKPRLSMARFKPGTNKPYGDNVENLRQDIADDIIDLQVALGVDNYVDDDADGVDPLDRGNGVIDAGEWYYDDPTGAAEVLPALGTEADLQLVRISTLARTQGRDFQYISKPFENIENHVYNEDYNENNVKVVERSYHRRLLQTVINLRNM